MLDKHVWEFLAKEEIVPEPKLPNLSGLVNKVRAKGCRIEIVIPSDIDELIEARVSRGGQTFTASEERPDEALAIATVDCLRETGATQLSLSDPDDVNAEATKNLE